MWCLCPLPVISALGNSRFKSLCEWFFSRLLEHHELRAGRRSALLFATAALLFATAASSAIRRMLGLHFVRFLCKLEWISDYILSKVKQKEKTMGIDIPKHRYFGLIAADFPRRKIKCTILTQEEHGHSRIKMTFKDKPGGTIILPLPPAM